MLMYLKNGFIRILRFAQEFQKGKTAMEVLSSRPRNGSEKSDWDAGRRGGHLPTLYAAPKLVAKKALTSGQSSTPMPRVIKASFMLHPLIMVRINIYRN